MKCVKQNYLFLYPLILGVIPLVAFFIFKSFGPQTGIIVTVCVLTYFILYIPVSIFYINRKFPFDIKSVLKSVFWLPYITFFLMCIFFALSMATIFLYDKVLGGVPHYMLAGVIILPAFFASIALVAIILKASSVKKGSGYARSNNRSK